MEKLESLKNLESLLGNLSVFLNIILSLAGFLFLTIWGWIIILILFTAAVLFKARNKRDEITFSGILGSFSETLLSLYSNITAIIVSIAVLFFLYTVAGMVRNAAKDIALFREVKTMEAALKNLRTDRKLAEVGIQQIKSGDSNTMNVRIRYFAYSPVKEQDVFIGEAAYSIEGKKLYINFGVLNFDFSMIEKGTAKNIAFPNKIYSDTVSYENGSDILARNNNFPLSFQLDEKDIFVLDEKTYQETMLSILESVTNSDTARKLGIRSSYGEAFALSTATGLEKVYTFVSTPTGGVIYR